MADKKIVKAPTKPVAAKPKAPAKAPVKPAAKSGAKPPAKGSAKTPVKASAKSGAKAPAKKPSTSRAKKVVGPTIAVFVDIENANTSRDNLLELFTNLKNKGTVTYGKLYGFRFDKAIDYDEIVAEYRLETVGRMRFKHGDDSVIDTRLVVDSIVAAESRKYDFIFIWAGVGDLMTLFAHIKELGCKVMTVDLPVFDTTNKFVDSRVKLFSPHSLHKPVPMATPVTTYSAATIAPEPPPMPRPSAVVSSNVPRQSDSFGAIADTDDDEDFDDLEDFDDSDLDDIIDFSDDDDDEEEGDGGDYDDFDDLDDEDEDFEGDDEDEDGMLEEIAASNSGADVFTSAENEKLLALTQQMLSANKKGDKKFSVKEAAKGLQDDFGDLGGGIGDGALEGAPGSVQDDEESKTKYGSASFDYNAEQSGIIHDTNTVKPGGDDDFGDFGKI
jgi:hypothetical protein